MPSIVAALLLVLALTACADITYSDAPGSNIEVEDSEEVDEPIFK